MRKGYGDGLPRWQIRLTTLHLLIGDDVEMCRVFMEISPLIGHNLTFRIKSKSLLWTGVFGYLCLKMLVFISVS